MYIHEVTRAQLDSLSILSLHKTLVHVRRENGIVIAITEPEQDPNSPQQLLLANPSEPATFYYGLGTVILRNGKMLPNCDYISESNKTVLVGYNISLFSNATEPSTDTYFEIHLKDGSNSEPIMITNADLRQNLVKVTLRPSVHLYTYSSKQTGYSIHSDTGVLLARYPYGATLSYEKELGLLFIKYVAPGKTKHTLSLCRLGHTNDERQLLEIAKFHGYDALSIVHGQSTGNPSVIISDTIGKNETCRLYQDDLDDMLEDAVDQNRWSLKNNLQRA